MRERNKNGVPHLLLAACFGHAEAYELLLEKSKANIEKTELGRNTALNLTAIERTCKQSDTAAVKGSKGGHKERKWLRTAPLSPSVFT